MRVSTKVRWFAVLGVVIAASVPAIAQTAASTPAAASDAQVGFQRKAQLSPQQQVAEGLNQLSSMEQAAGSIRRQLSDARAQRDVVKTLCLNDKLSQVDVAIRSAKDRQQSLQLAAGRNDSELSTHEFTIMTVLRQRGEQLTAEANQCIGEEGTVIGETSSKVTVDPSLPPDPETVTAPIDPGLFSQPPVCTSCSR